MPVNAADIHTAINAVWDDTGLDGEFQDLWTAQEVSDGAFEVLHDGEASPGTPFPYCVFEMPPGVVITRMSGGKNDQHQIRDQLVTFKVYAKTNTGDSRTAKRIAADLAAEVMKIFGGHPTALPELPELENGTCLIVQYLSDFGVKVGDSEHMWQINYNCRCDVPVAI